jgi:hypothetical protein
MWVGSKSHLRVRSRLLVFALVVGAAGAVEPPSAAACSGGTTPDWAVAHQRGGIVRGIVVTSEDRSDFTTDLILANLERVAGDPPPTTQLNVVAGAVCDQSADPGETIVVVFDIRDGEVPYPLPLYYVVTGPDALEPEVVAALFGPAAALPPPVETPTDPPPAIEAVVSGEPAADLVLPLVFVAAAVIGGLGLLLLADARRRRPR